MACSPLGLVSGPIVHAPAMASLCPPGTPPHSECPHKTILISSLKKSFLSRGPVVGREGPRQTLLTRLRQYGLDPVACVIFYRSRTALVEYPTQSDAASVLRRCATDPLLIEGHAVDVRPGDQPFKSDKVKRGTTDATLIHQAAADCMASMIKEVVKRLDEENRMRRAIERRQHRQLLRELAAQAGAQVRDDVCWDFVLANGRASGCKRGAACPFVHELVPVHQLPASLRHYVVHADSFTRQRESHEDKRRVNEALVRASAGLANRRCLVLDGAQCNSAKALLGCPAQGRRARDVVVPNSCTQTYLAIQAAGTCLAYHGSLRAFLDENAGAAAERCAAPNPRVAPSCSPSASLSGTVGAAPLPCPFTGLSKHRNPRVSALLGFFWYHRFCGANPIETGLYTPPPPLRKHRLVQARSGR